MKLIKNENEVNNEFNYYEKYRKKFKKYFHRCYKIDLFISRTKMQKTNENDEIM